MTDHPTQSTAGSERFYPAIAASTDAAAAQKLEAARQQTSFASCMILPPAGHALEAAHAKPLVDLLQAAGVAAIIADDATLARTLKADGVHLTWRKNIVAAYTEAREIIGGRFIVGVDVGRTRHDAMSLAEAGADYIAFGIPESVEDIETASRRRLELIGWWSVIFEVPCVACNVTSIEAASELAEAGADFVSMALPQGVSIAELNTWVDQAVSALDVAVPEATG